MFSFLQPGSHSGSNTGGFLAQLHLSPLFDSMNRHDWVSIPLAIIVAFALGKMLALALRKTLRHISAQAQTRNSLLDALIKNTRKPIEALIALGILGALMPFLKLDKGGALFIRHIEFTLLAVVLTWLVFGVADAWAIHKIAVLNRRGQKSKANVIPLVRRIFKAFLSIVLMVSILQNYGVNVMALVAGLGIGGIAIALAGQKTVENLFGGITLIFDQPFRVGDYISSSSLAGTVEDIGMRSSRIRTSDRTIITVPNADLAQMHIENFATRDRIRLTTTIGLRQETSPDQMRYILVEIQKMLLAHPRVDRDPVRVRFVNFGASSLDVEIYCFALTQDTSDFMAIREDIYLRLMDIVTTGGSGFAFPSQTLYHAADSGLDSKQVKQAEKTVAEARRKGELLVPTIPDTVKAKLAGTLDWPPTGSALENDMLKKGK